MVGIPLAGVDQGTLEIQGFSRYVKSEDNSAGYQGTVRSRKKKTYHQKPKQTTDITKRRQRKHLKKVVENGGDSTNVGILS